MEAHFSDKQDRKLLSLYEIMYVERALEKWLDHGLAPQSLFFIYFYFAQLAQKQFFTNVSKNTSLEKYLNISQENFRNLIINLQVKGNAQFVQKVTFEPWIDFKQNHYVNRKCCKSEKLLLLKLRFTKVIRAHSYFF